MLAAAYASTLGLHAVGRYDYAGDEPHYLLTAKSLVDDGDLDLTNQYRSRAYDAACRDHGFADGFALIPTNIGMVHVSDDPERDWARIGPRLCSGRLAPNGDRELR